MLPKKERLSRKEFNRFFSLGKRVSAPVFQIVYAPHKKLHVSIVVSKKIVPHAVERNKLRRRMYAIVRNYREEKTLSGVFIFIGKRGIEKLPYQNLKEEVVIHITKLLKYA